MPVRLQAEVPRALADALREGRLSAADYHTVRNLEAADKDQTTALTDSNGLDRTERHEG